ncbi:MAG: hypothetical protein KAQ85_05000 [Thermodesulfovibrionia bacterium]|nr:hypothetical protein [Thermodesulfovibrionia bacterium]
MKLLFDTLKTFGTDNLLTKRLMIFSSIMVAVIAWGVTFYFNAKLALGIMLGVCGLLLVGVFIWLIWMGVCFYTED